MPTVITPPRVPEIDGRQQKYLAVRQQCRTNLLYLARNVLGYKDVDATVHGPIIGKLQKFPGGIDAIQSNGTLVYTPHVPIWNLTGKRKRLILDPRGHLKTSLISQAHTIQWILNYGDIIRILTTTATSDLSQKILKEIKGHFQFNEIFRGFFPELCPPAKRAGDWGNLESFTVPGRKKVLREATCETSSIGRTIAGSHYEVLVCSDMVDKQNVGTPGAIQEVIDHFRYMDPLLERSEIPPHNGWVTMEGTRYDFGDLYGTIIDQQEHLPEEEKWDISVRSAEVDVATKRTLWPSRYPWSQLKAMEATMEPRIYSAQMLNHPIPSSGGLATLEDLIGIWMSRDVVTAMLPRMNLHCTVDLASMDQHKKAGGDFIVLTVCGFDRQGMMIVVDIRRGHFNETETIDQFYSIANLYPELLDFKVEKEAYWTTLAPFLKREQHKRGFLPPIVDIKRDTQKSKQQRIQGLQPWFKAKLIRFAADLTERTALFQEITRFPSQAVHDDILDTLADQLQNRLGGVNVDVVPMLQEQQFGQPRPEDKFLEFDPLTKEARFLFDVMGNPDNAYDGNGI